MPLDRRALLAVLGLGAAASAASAQTQPTAPAPQAELADRIAARAQENRHRLAYDGSRFSGPAWDLLLNEGRQAQFFCIGEEHGIAENPKLAAQLFRALTESGYSKACVEISPPMAAELDRAARDGVSGLRALFSDPRAAVAFFGMREEAEWIVAVRDTVAGGGQAVWGLDYEVGGTGRLIDRLQSKRKPRAAEAPFQALFDAAAAAGAQYAQTRNPQFIFSFSGDPALVRAVREAWARPDDDDAAWMLETLEETLAINRLWMSNQGWASNQRRAMFNRANFRRYWEAAEDKPKVMFKFGASHMVRGISHTQVLDIGTQVSELAEARGGSSFHVAVFPGPGAQVAQFDPSAWTYRPGDVGAYEAQGMTPLISAAYRDAFTLVDLRPLRPLVFGRQHKALDADLVRTIHGFDALLVMSGSTPSANL
ncbi:MAG TPA: hypothetical protein VEF55_12495 [Candidatus Binatia bacterium]|nr:hypothetical protein [Candidatus Binatia bacterium]